MAGQKEMGSGVEWKIRVADGSSETLAPQAAGLAGRVWLGLKNMIAGFVLKVWRFLEKAWDLGADDPRKVIHCLKVGIALTVVSLFYYMRPLYDGVGGNAMWAVMTVVVVFENTVGATLYKCLNRVFGTILAGLLAVGVHWVAVHSGEKFEPLIIGVSVFILASAATFSRFIPSVKARFDYGTMIFILTFSLVAVSGYRVDKLFDLAHQRLSTIIIGTSLCIIVGMVVCPIWAGRELYSLINRNMDKLANSLEGYAAEYFNQSEEEAHKKLLDYKCILNSKATEESMANFARWEPAHGRFNFRHPWKQYLKIGAAMRSCAYCIEALNGCINSANQGPEFIKKHLSSSCLKVSSDSSSVIKELAKIIKTMTKSSTIDLLVGEMNNAVEDLQNDLKTLSGLFNPEDETPENNNETQKTSLKTTTEIPLLGVISVVTFASLLIEIASRIEAVVEEVEKLANLAEFQVMDQCKSKQNQASTEIIPADDQNDKDNTIKTLEKV
ncbi:aluminum-activated malate transporter 10-like isoform X2 [Pistacia vera]|uniref:aluminum-activated malate transporter 10-like isoform X2 n=1 Tax=Pistacia vera TaxID=55513 RepID=UPI001263DE10|nr:aluminum-activated malate transporter 10-like isoform X2 [Pistacia vera]